MIFGRYKVWIVSLTLHLGLVGALSYFARPTTSSNSRWGGAVKINLLSGDKISGRPEISSSLSMNHSFDNKARHRPYDHDSLNHHRNPIEASAQSQDLRVAQSEHFVDEGSLGYQSPVLERDSVVVPRFTADALNRGFRGMLVLDLFLDEDGDVIDLKLRNPTGLEIDREAISSARSAKYRPARDIFGRPIASVAELRFEFMGH